MKRTLKHFESGSDYVTLESDSGNYTVSLYTDNAASEALKAVPTSVFETTTLDAAIEFYGQTCKEATRRANVRSFATFAENYIRNIPNATA